MENLGKITATLMLIVVSMFIGLLKTYIVLDVGSLYNIEFIESFTFIQMLGIIYIIGIVSFKLKGKNKPENKEFLEYLTDDFVKLISLAASYLVLWGLCYLMYKIIS